MKRLTFLLLGGILVSSAARAGQQTGYWQQRFRYTMQVQLHPEDHRVVAHSSIVYVNQSPDTLDRIYLHLYPRAFNPKSVKYREFLHALGRQGRAAGFMKNPEPYEWDLQIQDFSATTSDGSATQSYELDDTIFRTLLPVPLVPGDSVRLELDWTLKVGRMFERAGEIDGQYNMAQWYPKLVVYDQTGWHPDVFHAEGEFYGEYGDFDVTLDVPNNYIIGATGVVTEGDPGWEAVRVDTSMGFSDWLEQAQFPEPDSSRRRVVRFRARQVHDFAWVASPDYVYESGEWNGIQVHVLYNKSHPQWSKVVVQRAEEALRWLSTQFGLYPWPQMTVTDRLRGGGMEYPMLVMNGRESEGLIVHEIGHNWFYGILGNNEVDQAWLDEGFTTFQTRWHALTEYPGGNAPRPWLKPYQQKFWKFTSYYDNDQWRAIRAVTSGFDEPVQRKSYLYKSGANYGVNAYTKPSLMLHELKAILGEPVFLSAMQHYFHLWELKHVDEYRFRQAIEEAAGRELDWFFDPWLHDTRYTDFQLKSLRSTPNPDGTWHTVVKVTQRGDRLLPPVVDLVFRDGSTQRLAEPDFLWRWDYTLEADSPQKPVKAIVDPDNDFLDVDRRNNYSGAMSREILFNWPGMSYRPRSA
ncbi:MAG: M1 family peptidase, partial [Candidatus Neomarinimicrobiota bacterium]